TITGGTGIDIVNQTFAAGSAIVNTGTITGTNGTAIDLEGTTNAVRVDIDGGAINGNIVGVGGAGDTLNFAPGAGNTFTYANSFSNFNQVGVGPGTVVLTGTGTATALTVNSGGTLAGTGTLASAVSVNAGGALK